ncbi:hypothetical protein ACTXT7_015766 [Hymenolepis weldensis]
MVRQLKEPAKFNDSESEIGNFSPEIRYESVHLKDKRLTQLLLLPLSLFLFLPVHPLRPYNAPVVYLNSHCCEFGKDLCPVRRKKIISSMRG